MDSRQAFIATCDPSFADLALDEIRKVVGVVHSQSTLAPGVSMVESEHQFIDVASRWRDEPPVFVRHICPVDVSIALTGDDDDVSSIVSAALDSIATRLDPMQEFSVQARLLAEVGFKPYDINTQLSTALTEASGCALNVRSPQQVVSVVVASPPDATCATAYVGLSQVDDNLSDWAGGMRRFARESGQVSRSEFKLLEALEVFGIELLPHGVGLDLGAAPGGWTRVMRQHGLYVTAVDPGALHASIKGDSGVRHLRFTAEEYLARGPDHYDLIVNDMRMDGRDSARLMVKYADSLHSTGQVLMTLKLPERNRRSVIDHSLKILRRRYSVLGVKQLFHNRSEVTLYLAPQTGSQHSVDENAE